jgi:hypothetical protein
LTSSNPSALAAIVGPSVVFELTGTNENLTALLALVYAAAGRRPNGSVDPAA